MKFSEFALSMEPPALRRLSVKVAAVNGINLGQGTCQLPVPEEVSEFAKQAIDEGINRYTNPKGLQSLRDAIIYKYNNRYSDEEILVTSGATGAYDSLCEALLDRGEKAALIEPYYPYHRMVLKKYGAQILTIPLSAPDWRIDFDLVEKALKENPKIFVISNPGNPTGKVYSESELQKLIELCSQYNCRLISDETYEYITYRPFTSAGKFKSNNVCVVGSFSKTFSITGWRVGYLLATPDLIDIALGLHDLTYICSPAPLQEGVARAVKSLPQSFYTELCGKYKIKRDILVSGLTKAGFNVYDPQGSYYLIGDFREIDPSSSSYEFVEKMIERCGVGAVPSNDFVSKEAQWARFCYALEDSVLVEAVDKLSTLKN